MSNQNHEDQYFSFNDLLNGKQTEIKKMSGKLWDEYQIYLANTPSEYPKTFDEWLES